VTDTLEYAPLGMDYQNPSMFDSPINEDSLIENLINFGKGLTPKGGGDDSEDFIGSEKKADPQKIVWSYIVHTYDDDYDQIIKAVTPLGEFHDMENPQDPLEFACENDFQWSRWIKNNINKKDPEQIPTHILIVANPEQIPFGFQSRLSKRAKIGRICFDEIKHYENYVNKVTTLSKTPPPNLKKHASFFATNYGKKDVTWYSFNELATPLKQYLDDKNIPADMAELECMTHSSLVKKLKTTDSALVFFAGHGIGNVTKENQKDLQGAFCCQDWINTRKDSELFTACDVPDEPFLEGSMFINFSCFGYGTPKEDDIVKFSTTGDRTRKTLSEESFVAALPKKLLAHPRGPIGYIGHSNSLYLSGFYTKNATIPDDQKRDISAFLHMLAYLFKKDTLGKSIEYMNDMAGEEADRFSDSVLRFQGGDKTRETKFEIAESFFQSHDIDNYLLFGDPAIKLNCKI